MEIRSAKKAELVEIVDLQCLVFRPDESAASTRYWAYFHEEPTYQFEQSRILIEQGRIVAHLRIWDRQIRVRGATLRVGGIGSVLTHPDFRGRGYAQALIRDAELYMQQAGYDLGMLFTIIGTPFYAKLGWIPLPLPTFSFPVGEPTTAFSDSARILDDTADLPAVMALYDAANANQTGTEIRNSGYWRSGPSRYRKLFPQKGIERNGELVGYLNYDNNGSDLKVCEVCFMPGDEEACQVVAHTLFAAAKKEGLKTIKGSLPPDHTLLARLADLSNSQPRFSQHQKTMVKMLDWGTIRKKLTDMAPADPPSDEAALWNELLNPRSASTPGWLDKLPDAQGFFYWDPDIF